LPDFRHSAAASIVTFGPRLVDDADDPERHPDAAQLEPVGQPAAVDDLADRVGQRGDVAHLGGDRGDPGLVEAQAVEQRVAQRGLATGLHVARVGLEDLGRARLQRVGDRVQRRVLGAAVEPGELPRRALGVGAQLGDGRRRTAMRGG
jgi:hypothetical protein